MPSIHQADGGVPAGSAVIALHSSGGSPAQWKVLEVELELLAGMGHLGPITHAQPIAQRIAAFVRQQATPTVDDRKAA